jgi:transposase InsO family protein
MITAVEKSHRKLLGSISTVCEAFGVKRNAYYKTLKTELKHKQNAIEVVAFVKHQRKIQSREGGRKLHKDMQDDLKMQELKIGRDKLFGILKEHDMLVKKKRSFVKTTDSNHHFRKHKNLIKDLEIVRPNQVWVADITYIRLIKGHCYLALITDLYSRKIVGYDVSNSLELAGCLRAFKRAHRLARPAQGLFHHSDRGSQYCSNEYVRLLKSHQVNISMTEQNHCYENAVAERVNGILKDEFYLDECFTNLDMAIKAYDNAIKIYNTKRLHLSLNYKTPDQVYNMIA